MFDVAVGCKNKAHEARAGNDGCQGRARAGKLESSPRRFGLSPLVINNCMIVGSRIRDNQAVDGPSGVVRAYDSKTGVLLWDQVPRNQ
jgi:glucose dehydrogenase